MEAAVRESAGAILLDVVVVPGSARSEIGDLDPWRHALKIRVAARAEAGAANDELVRFLAEFLEIPRSSVRIVTGQMSRRKTICVRGLDRDEFVRRIEGGL